MSTVWVLTNSINLSEVPVKRDVYKRQDLTLEDAYTKLAGNPAPDSLEAMLFNVEVISGKEGASEFMKRLSRKPAV